MLTMSSVTSDESKELTMPLKKPDHMPAVPDHRVNYKRRPVQPTPSKNNCCKRCLIFLTFLFCVSTLALIGVILWREFTPRECSRDNLPLNEMFPGYFRSKEQQKVFEDMVNEKGIYTTVNHSVAMGYECETKCSAYNTGNATTTTSIQFPDVCCESNVRYLPLAILINIEGATRTIAQSNNTFQYFRVETCSQNSGCKGCKCIQSQRLFTAVHEHTIDTAKKYSLDWFALPENCHCKIQS